MFRRYEERHRLIGHQDTNVRMLVDSGEARSE